jgi:hypothetical protein
MYKRGCWVVEIIYRHFIRMLHDERNKLCQRNIFTDIVTAEDVMKQVEDKLVVPD